MATLKELREQKLMTMEELAVKAGVNRRTIERLENNLHTPYFKTIRNLAIALDVQPDMIEFKQTNTNIVPCVTAVASYDINRITDSIESLRKEIERLDKDIDAIIKVFSNESNKNRFWIGWHEIKTNMMNELQLRIIENLEKFYPGIGEQLVKYGKRVMKENRDNNWPAIPLPGEPGANTCMERYSEQFIYREPRSVVKK
jgi:transcriptional regulator with XRE-family HTH domain